MSIIHMKTHAHILACRNCVWVKNFNCAWWRHQMETFSALLATCAGNSSVTSEFPAQWPVTRSFDVFFDLRLNKRLSKRSWGWWFETPCRPLWRHCNDLSFCHQPYSIPLKWCYTWRRYNMDTLSASLTLSSMRGINWLPVVPSTKGRECGPALWWLLYC